MKARYGLAGDGVTDDTAGLQRAITENKGLTLVLAKGTYLVSAPLQAVAADGSWRSGLRLYGQNRDQTVIRLADSATGFGDPAHPVGVVVTGSDAGGSDGSGNRAFGNFVENLTIDTGLNAGAYGIDYLANNGGAVRDIVVRGTGVAGIAMVRAWPGPCLVQNVRVTGFQYGVLVRQAQYAATLEHVQVTGQSVAGLRNEDNILSIRDLRSVNAVPAVQNAGLGFVTLVDGSFLGGAATVPAIDSTADLFLRNIVTAGYAASLRQNGTSTSTANIVEWTSRAPVTLFAASPQTSLALPVQEAPAYADGPATGWANIVNYGGLPDDYNDDVYGLQAAIDSGASTVYLPPGRYYLGSTLHVRGNVRHIVGLGATISPQFGTFADASNPQPLISIENGAGADVTIEGVSLIELYTSSPNPAGMILFQHATSRVLYLKDITALPFTYYTTYRAATGVGNLFIDNTTLSQWVFDQNQAVFARDFDVEASTTRVINRAARLWVLGVKSESAGTIVDTEAGASSEILGGSLYPVGSVPATDIAFVNNGGAMSASYATIVYSSGADYTKQIAETRGATTATLTAGSTAGRGLGHVVPLYVGR